MSYVITLPSHRKGVKKYLYSGWYGNITGDKRINKAVRYKTIEEARAGLAKIIRETRDSIKTNKKLLSNPNNSKDYYEERLKTRIRSLKALRGAEIVEFTGNFGYDAAKRGKVYWSKTDPFTKTCNCCGFVIPVESYLTTLNMHNICPVCIAQAAEQSKNILARLEQENPELYQTMISEMFLKEL